MPRLVSSSFAGCPAVLARSRQQWLRQFCPPEKGGRNCYKTVIAPALPLYRTRTAAPARSTTHRPALQFAGRCLSSAAALGHSLEKRSIYCGLRQVGFFLSGRSPRTSAVSAPSSLPPRAAAAILLSPPGFGAFGAELEFLPFGVVPLRGDLSSLACVLFPTR